MTGSIRQRGPDSWQVRVSVGEDPATGRYRYVTKTVKGGKRAAQRVAAELAAGAASGTYRPRARGNVEDLLTKWMEHLEGQDRAETTLVRYRSVIRTHLVPALGTIPVEKLTAADLDALYARQRKAGLGPLSIRKSHAILSAALHQAQRWDWIDHNPAERASPPPQRQPEIVVPTNDQVRELIEMAETTNPELASLIYVAATTGLRRGELCGLRWNDVDLEAPTLVVARSISDVPGKVSVKTTKTHQARRIAIDPSTAGVLRHRRIEAEGFAHTCGTSLRSDGYLWSQVPDGAEPWRPGRITSAFQVLRQNAGMPDVTFHSLRHFSATTLAGTGVGVRTIAGRLGHANPSVTLRTYAHFLDAPDREAADQMAGVAAALLTTRDGAFAQVETDEVSPPSTRAKSLTSDGAGVST